MFIQLLFLTALEKLHAFPIDRNYPLSKNTDNLLQSRVLPPEAGNNMRTTYGIVSSCLVTILACVWSAVHPNMPGPYDAGWIILKRRMTTTFCVLLVPELMVVWALRQHLAAKYIKETYNRNFVRQADTDLGQSDTPRILFKFLASARKAVNEWFTELPDKAAVRRKPWPIKSRELVRNRDSEPWTMTHAFFIQMGGFMLYHGETPKEVLEFGNMCYLISTEQIAAPTVTEVELKDRSKGNALSKGIVLLQTSWFVVQCLARLASRLPLSELEVVTLAFAVMNGIVYWVWWDKPQGVNTAIPIHLESLEGHGWDTTEAASGNAIDNLTPGIPELQPPFHHRGKIKFPANSIHSTATYSNKHWKLILSFLRKFLQVVGYPFKKLAGMMESNNISYRATNVPMFYAYDSLESNNSLPLISAAMFIGMLFGAVHFFAWSSVFSSHAEQMIWRVSSLITTIGPIIGFFTLFMDQQCDHLEFKGSRWENIVRTITHILGIPFTLALVAYIPARIALLTVAILSLRASPQDIFTQISWTTFIPHL